MAQFNITGGLTQGQTGGELGNNPPQFSGSVQLGCGAGGEGGTTNYNDLLNKPQINSVELVGNKTLSQLGIEPAKGADDNFVTDTEKAAVEDLVTDYAAGKVLSDNNFTDAEKTQGAISTNNATLTTLKQVADYTTGLTFKLIGSFTPTVGTNAFSTTFDGSGNLLNTLNIKRCIVEIYTSTSATTLQTGFIRINNTSTNTYKQTVNVATGILFLHITENYHVCTMDFTGILKYWTNSVRSNSTANDSSFAAGVFQGINRTIVNSTLSQLDVVLGGGATFQANSIVNIYVL